MWPSRKLAVLKDDEVDRLERASAACTGASRQEVMESMYNRLEPKPKGACRWQSCWLNAHERKPVLFQKA